MEETIRKLVYGMNETISEANTKHTNNKRRRILLNCVMLLRSIDKLCDIFRCDVLESTLP